MLMSINHNNVLSEFPFYNLDNQEFLRFAWPRPQKVLLRTYCNVGIKTGLFKEHFESAKQENYFLYV